MYAFRTIFSGACRQAPPSSLQAGIGATPLRRPRGVLGVYALGCMAKRQLIRALPVDGKFIASELPRRGPGLFVTSVVTGGAEARSRMAPQKIERWWERKRSSGKTPRRRCRLGTPTT